MRVIAGEAKGRRLEAPKGMRVRPTLDRVRESLFNILGPRLHGCRFLDLFAGSGANGIEALSRGAASCTFVDADERSLKVLRSNVLSVGFAGRSRVKRLTLPSGLERLGESESAYDVVFADPPYDFVHYPRLLEALGQGILARDGLAIIEHASRAPLEPPVGPLVKVREERYGDTMLTFFS